MHVCVVLIAQALGRTIKSDKRRMAYYLDPIFRGGPEDIYFKVDIECSADHVMRGLPVPKTAVRGPFRVTTAQKTLPDFVFFQAIFFGVSQRALDTLLSLIDPAQLDPIPIEINDKHGGSIPGSYYLLNVLTFRNSLILDETNVKTNPRFKGMLIDCSKLKMRRADISGAHLWHETYPQERRRYELFASAELIAAAKSQKLRGLNRAIQVPEF